MTDIQLQQRCLRFGWRLDYTAGEWVLLGNGAPAAFRTMASLEVWLEKQEKPQQADVEPQQTVMDFAA